MVFGLSGASDASPKIPLQRSVQPADTNLVLRTDNDFKMDNQINSVAYIQFSSSEAFYLQSSLFERFERVIYAFTASHLDSVLAIIRPLLLTYS